MNAKLSIWSQYYYEMTPEEAVDEFIRNGLSCCELSDEHGAMLLSRSDDVTAVGTQFAQYLQARNFEISQGHLWLSCKIVSDETALARLFRWVDLYAAIGIRNMVLHCDSMQDSALSNEEKLWCNIEKFRLLAAHIEGRDIMICLENLRGIVTNVDELLFVIEQVGSEQFGICLDTGHLNLTEKDQQAFIRKAGKKLHALHIADNEGERDQHMMMFTRGQVNFAEVVTALREVDYHGLFNLEIPGESRIPLPLRNAKIQYIKACYDYLMAL